jgi:hypothetical protein
VLAVTPKVGPLVLDGTMPLDAARREARLVWLRERDPQLVEKIVEGELSSRRYCLVNDPD